MSCLEHIDKTITEQKDLYDISVLYQFKGKEFYYNAIYKKDLKSQINAAIEKEIKALITLRDLEISPQRVKLLIKNDTEPKNDSERFIANARSIFETFAYHIAEFDFDSGRGSNQIARISEELFRGIKKISFGSYNKKIQENMLVFEEETSRREFLVKAISAYDKHLRDKDNELIVLVSAFYVDFVKCEIFDSETELIGLFLIYALLYKESFQMFRYVSFFEIYNMYKDEFAAAYLESQMNWKKGFANAAPLARVLRKMLIMGYHKLDEVTNARSIWMNNNKTDQIEVTIMRTLPQVFTREMIKQYHPDVAKITIDRTLMRLRDENKIRANGGGRSASWIRLEEDNSFNRKKLENKTVQLDLFDIAED